MSAYKSDSRQRQLLVEARYLKRLHAITVVSCHDHGVETVLDSSKDLGILLQDLQHLNIRLLDTPNRYGQLLSPVGET